MKQKIFLVLVLSLFVLSGNAKQWVLFHAEEGYIGHAFAVFVQEDAGGRPVTIGTYGYGPAFSNIHGVNFPSGDIGYTFYAEVNNTVWDKCLSTVKEWNEKLFYFPIAQDCVAFMKALINNIDSLSKPNVVYFFPSEYIEQLKRLNQKLNSRSQSSLAKAIIVNKNTLHTEELLKLPFYFTNYFVTWPIAKLIKEDLIKLHCVTTSIESGNDGKWIYQFKNNELTKATRYDPYSGKVASMTEYEYEHDKLGRPAKRVARKTEFSLDDRKIEIEAVKYDEKNNIIEYNTNWKDKDDQEFNSYQVYTYNNQGQLLTSALKAAMVKEVRFTQQNTYDEWGRLTKRIDIDNHVLEFKYQDFPTTLPKNSSEAIIIYVKTDDKGRVIEQKGKDLFLNVSVDTPTPFHFIYGYKNDVLISCTQLFGEGNDISGRMIEFKYNGSKLLSDVQNDIRIANGKVIKDLKSQIVRVYDEHENVITEVYSDGVNKPIKYLYQCK